MNPKNKLTLGQKYTKKELFELLNEKGLLTMREGVFNCSSSASYLLFVDLEKTGKEKQHQYKDYFENNYFHWDSQNQQNFQSKKIQEIVTGQLTTYLFARTINKIKGKTQPFVYCGQLNYHTHDEATQKPVHIIFKSEDFDEQTNNPDLRSIYEWKPNKNKNETQDLTQSNITHTKQKQTQSKLNKPNITTRKSTTDSRVGQGYFRQELIKLWNGKCPITGIDLLEILKASHIVGWADCEESRLDSHNGILLSPMYDALFDQHLISFTDDGSMLISNRLSEIQVKQLNINDEIQIQFTDRMKEHLKIHRKNFHEKQL